MSKRSHDSSLDYIVKKLRKLEKQVKQTRKRPRSLSSTSSSSSQSSSGSSKLGLEQTDDWRHPTTYEDGAVISLDSPPEVITHDEAFSAAPPDAPIEALAEVPSAVPSAAPSAPALVHESAIDDTSVLLVDDIDQILGVDPTATADFGPDINKDVAIRFTHIATMGLDKEIRKELINKYTIPGNCAFIASPELNAEIKGTLADHVTKRDKAIQARQKQIATGITAIGRIISDQLSAKDKNHDLIKDLMDVGRIFCDVQHTESEARRNFALYSVKKELKDQLSNTKIDKFLFGTDLHETLKTAKAVSISTRDLKPETSERHKNTTRAPVTAAKPLNWRARTATHRQPTGLQARYQPPAPPSAPLRGNLSRTFMQQPKQSRRN